MRWVLAPVVIVASVVVFPVLIIVVLPCVFLLVYLGRIRFLRKAFMGRATCVCDDFLKKLEELEPKRIVFEGNRAINTRHGCSIAVTKAVTVLAKPLPRKGPSPMQPVFGIKFGKDCLTCSAQPPGRKFPFGNQNILEERTLSAFGHEIRFRKHRSGHASNRSPHLYFDWQLEASRATYHFFYTSERDLKPAELEALEKIVLSFKV